jgi:hypothetical protein
MSGGDARQAGSSAARTTGLLQLLVERLVPAPPESAAAQAARLRGFRRGPGAAAAPQPVRAVAGAAR